MDALALVLVVLLAVVLAGGLLVVGIARANRRANEVVPGVATSAPTSWAGAHTAEARLHRRLRDAVRGLQAQGGDAVAGVRSDIERASVELDERLVAVAALPERVRAEPLAQVERAVAALEDAAALLASRAGGGLTGTPSLAEEVAERLRLLDAARAELDAIAPEPSRRHEPGTA